MANRQTLEPNKRNLIAHAAPIFLFVLFLGFTGVLKQPGETLWRSHPELWVYPLQTILCGTLLICFWPSYRFRPVRGLGFAALVAIIVFVIWIGPQQFLGFAPRRVGFNPDQLAPNPALYWATIALRMLRLVVVVPLLEEIFWRGFLLRYLIAEDFESIPFGSFSWLSFGVVTIAFALSHSVADWPAAIVTGALYNLVAYRTKSLAACVEAHALTNLALGCWILTTRQWGFW